MLELHTAATGNGAKPLLVLEELGLPYRLRKLDLARREQDAPSYRALHPGGRIPLLRDETNGLVLFESLAIVLYLCEKTARLLPVEPSPRAQALQWMAYVATNLEPRGVVFHRARREGWSEAIPASFAEEYDRFLWVLDAHLGQETYLAGSFTAADLFAYPYVRNLAARDAERYARLPHLASWAARMAERPSVRTAYARLEES
jgi:GST-like protein